MFAPLSIGAALVSAAVGSEGHRLVLQIALASLEQLRCNGIRGNLLTIRSQKLEQRSMLGNQYLVTNRTVQWMIDQQELHHTFASLNNPLYKYKKSSQSKSNKVVEQGIAKVEQW